MTRAPAPAPRTLRPVAWIMDTLAAIPRALPELHGKDEGAKGAELGDRQFGTARVLPSSIDCPFVCGHDQTRQQFRSHKGSDRSLDHAVLSSQSTI